MLQGEQLRRHMLWQAKNVFLDVGFERASMDTIAKRAGTTKRTLYKHFDSKERLFLDVVDLVRNLLDEKLGTPGDCDDDPIKALSLFCGRLRRSVIWGPTIRTCRLGIGEAARFPEGASGFYQALFGTTIDRMALYVGDQFGLPIESAHTVAGELLSLSLEPSFTRALFGVENVPEDLSDEPHSDHAVGADRIRLTILLYENT